MPFTWTFKNLNLEYLDQMMGDTYQEMRFDVC